MKMGQTASLAANAYNSYNWPTSTGTAGQQLTIASLGSGIATLAWDDPDRIPWTAKGQLVVGTGLNTETLLNVGANGSILIADSTQTSGLNYTTKYVPTTSATGSAIIPAGTLVQRDSSPVAGYFRYDSNYNAMEFYDGGNWQVIASSTTGNYVSTWSGGTTGLTPAAATTGAVTLGGVLGIANGGTGQTTTAGALNGLLPSQSGNAGQVLTTNGSNTSWTPFVSSIVAGTNVTITPAGGTGAVTINSASANALLPSQAGNAGEVLSTDGTNTYWTPFVSSIVAGTNITITPVGGTGAVTISAAGSVAGVSSFSAGSTGLTPAGATSGVVSLGGTLSLTNGGTGATTQTGAANNILPSQAGNAGYILTTDASNTSWVSLGTVGLTSWSGGTTGLTPSAATTGAVTVSGTLALASGGTGATTQATAANNILPSQAGNAGEFLTTDGTNVSWSSAATDIPSGTTMLFMQAAAPTGWTQVTTQNNVGIRIVNTAGGGTGGTISFSTLFSPTSTYTGSVTITSGQVGDTTLSVAQLASHDHYLGNVCTWGGSVDDPPGAGNNHNNSQPTSATAGSSDVHTHTLIGVVAGGNFTSNFDLQYVDVIAASKN
jgi:hypothetical protein